MEIVRMNDMQKGFMSGRSGIGVVLISRRLQEEHRKNRRSSTYILCILHLIRGTSYN